MAPSSGCFGPAGFSWPCWILLALLGSLVRAVVGPRASMWECWKGCSGVGGFAEGSYPPSSDPLWLLGEVQPILCSPACGCHCKGGALTAPPPMQPPAPHLARATPLSPLLSPRQTQLSALRVVPLQGCCPWPGAFPAQSQAISPGQDFLLRVEIRRKMMEEPLASVSFTSCLLQRAWTQLGCVLLLIGAVSAWRGRKSSRFKATGWEWHRLLPGVCSALGGGRSSSCLLVLYIFT